MIGTEKQIAYANDVKAEQIAKWEAKIATFLNAPSERARAWGEKLRKVLDVAQRCEMADMWIERHGVSTIIHAQGLLDPASKAEACGLTVSEFMSAADQLQ